MATLVEWIWTCRGSTPISRSRSRATPGSRRLSPRPSPSPHSQHEAKVVPAVECVRHFPAADRRERHTTGLEAAIAVTLGANRSCRDHPRSIDLARLPRHAAGLEPVRCNLVVEPADDLAVDPKDDPHRVVAIG